MSDVEPTLLQGRIQAEGIGYDIGTVEDGRVSFSLEDSLVWNETIPLLKLGATLEDGVLILINFRLIIRLRLLLHLEEQRLFIANLIWN